MFSHLGLDKEGHSRQILNILEARRLGYAKSTYEELLLILGLCQSTGILTDRMPTLEAVFRMISEVKRSSQ